MADRRWRGPQPRWRGRPLRWPGQRPRWPGLRCRRGRKCRPDPRCRRGPRCKHGRRCRCSGPRCPTCRRSVRTFSGRTWGACRTCRVRRCPVPACGRRLGCSSGPAWQRLLGPASARCGRSVRRGSVPVASIAPGASVARPVLPRSPVPAWAGSIVPAVWVAVPRACRVAVSPIVLHLGCGPFREARAGWLAVRAASVRAGSVPVASDPVGLRHCPVSRPGQPTVRASVV